MHPLHDQFIDLLLQWNTKINLSAARTADEILHKHVEDSLALLPHIGEAKRLLDIGSGGGFPGIPVKIERPDLEIVLLEARQKRVSFLMTAIAALGLQKIQAVCGQAESLEVQQQLGLFDLVVSRATWNLGSFLPIALPYLAPKGRIIAFQGPSGPSQLQALNLQFSSLDLVDLPPCHYRLQGGEERWLLVFEKRMRR